MSAPTYEEMEAKRQEMIASFKDIAAAMTRCVSIIEDYARLSPSTLSLPTAAASSALLDPSAKKAKASKDKKAPRDPNAPKRPPSAYILFQNEVRESLRASNPGMAYKDVLGLISQKWKELSDEQKKIYEDAYSQQNAVFKAEDERYKGGLPASVAAPVASDSDSSDSDSDDSSEDTPPAPVKPVSKPAPTPAAEAKKEKKRKNKEEAEVAAAVGAVDGEKKKKKKNKD